MHSHFRSFLSSSSSGWSIIYRGFLPGPGPQYIGQRYGSARSIRAADDFFLFPSCLESLSRPLSSRREIRPGWCVSPCVVISYRFFDTHCESGTRSSFARFCVMARGIVRGGAREQLTSFLSIDVADTFSYRTISNREYPKVIKLRENLYFFFSFFFFLYIHIYIHTHIYFFSTVVGKLTITIHPPLSNDVHA